MLTSSQPKIWSGVHTLNCLAVSRGARYVILLQSTEAQEMKKYIPGLAIAIVYNMKAVFVCKSWNC
jgi:hypothetical protein